MLYTVRLFCSFRTFLSIPCVIIMIVMSTDISSVRFEGADYPLNKCLEDSYMTLAQLSSQSHCNPVKRKMFSSKTLTSYLFKDFATCFSRNPLGSSLRSPLPPRT